MFSSDPERQNIILHCLKSTDACKFIRGAVPRRRLKKSRLPTWPFIHRKLSLSANHPPKPRQVFAVEVKTSRAAFQTKKRSYLLSDNERQKSKFFEPNSDFFKPSRFFRSTHRKPERWAAIRKKVRLSTGSGNTGRSGSTSWSRKCTGSLPERSVALPVVLSCWGNQLPFDQRSLAASGSVSIWMGDRFRQILHIWATLHCWLCFMFRSSQP